MEGSGPTVCPLALLPTESQAPVLNGTLVASPCHDSPQARNHPGSWLASNSCGHRGQGRRLLRVAQKVC